MKVKVLRCSSLPDVLLSSMATPRSLIVDTGRLVRDDEETNVGVEDSPTSKKPINWEVKFPLTKWELTAALGLFLIFVTGLFCIYLTMPAVEYGKLKLPRTISDIRILKNDV